MNYKFQHFSVNGGHITVVSELIYPEFEYKYPIAIKFAVSFCSPKDVFTKKRGREIAVSRLETESFEFARLIPIRNYTKPNYLSLRNLVLATIDATMELPRWVYS